MSVELLLVPMAIAAVAAWKAKQGADAAGRPVVTVATRMKDERLLRMALADTGAVVAADRDGILGSWTGMQARFTRDADGIWAVHAWGAVTTQSVTELAMSIDSAYARRVQEEVVDRIRARAPEAGLTVASETVQEDDTVVLVLNVDREA
ncbi:MULTISPECIES: hypothetical protein [Citricoccus]|uniref:hypothetical protein n=1 Tax=Citricoccus TaxID=169133 RepID=UPI00048F7F14|nr:hypothetical protein [Citricoccus sp. CH26A]